MKKVIYSKDPCNGAPSTRIPIKLWLDEEKVEESAMKQIYNLCNLPFAYHHIAIMPDCHSGYGMPIGGVLATEGVVIPNAVGVDIGCGMCAVKTSLKAEQLDKETIKKIFGGSAEHHGGIRSAIPVGKGGSHSKKQDNNLMPDLMHVQSPSVCINEYDNALKQIGTLGGGNHFIEIQKESNKCPSCPDGWICDGCMSLKKCKICNGTGINPNKDTIWIMIHSGSRNLGYKVANHYNKLAIELNEKWFSSIPKEWELAFLPIETKEAKDYMLEMQYCVDFALANRKLMMERICDIIQFVCGYNKDTTIHFEEMINIAHNYASWENHFGKNVIVHRKGATLAREGTIGIIPGSQGTKSYIVKGLGNPESFMSCSHGAGRLMSRTKACNTLSLADEIKKMDEKGIVHGIRGKYNLDEAPGAYKNIDEVMGNQKDLVEILVELEPLAVIKGD